MTLESMQPIIVSVGVISAVVALIANVIVAYMNNRQLRKMNRDKFNNELIQYRYSKLYSILEDIGEEQGFINHIGNPQETFKDSFEKAQRFFELYTLAKPLLATELRGNLDSVSSDMLASRSAMIEFWSCKDLDGMNNEMLTWASVLNKFHNELTEAIQKQISEFTNFRTN